MIELPSDAPTPELAEFFPTYLTDVEKAVYDYVKAATEDGLASGIPALSFYADRARSAAEGLKVSVVRGWPAYPGVVPAIGVATGPEGEDQQHELPGGGFAGDAYMHDPVTGQAIGSATYFTEALSQTVIVELIHENRDERDRLHNELRRVLFPLRRLLPAAERLVRKVSIDAEKTEQAFGPPGDEEPIEMYVSLFTVHVLHEMLEATDVRGVDSIIGAIDVTVAETDTGE